MKVLKTIVATAVVVLATSSVAMAGAGQLTKAQDARPAEKKSESVQRRGELTEKHQLRRGDDRSAGHVREARRMKTQARRIHREHAQAQQGAHEAEAQHVERVHTSAQNEQGDHSGSSSPSGSHHYETSQQTHASSGGHDGGHGGGHGGD
jgi:hypothetical protein